MYVYIVFIIHCGNIYSSSPTCCFGYFEFFVNGTDLPAQFQYSWQPCLSFLSDLQFSNFQQLYLISDAKYFGSPFIEMFWANCKQWPGRGWVNILADWIFWLSEYFGWVNILAHLPLKNVLSQLQAMTRKGLSEKAGRSVLWADGSPIWPLAASCPSF